MKKKILVIDDEKVIRESFELALENTDYHLDTANSGIEGIKKERSKDYDLIFLDLKMPDIHGTEVLSEIRKVNKKTPIYIITAFHKEFFDELNSKMQEGLEFEFVKKPIGMDEIHLIVKSVLEGPTYHPA